MPKYVVIMGARIASPDNRRRHAHVDDAKVVRVDNVKVVIRV